MYSDKGSRGPWGTANVLVALLATVFGPTSAGGLPPVSLSDTRYTMVDPTGGLVAVDGGRRSRGTVASVHGIPQCRVPVGYRVAPGLAAWDRQGRLLVTGRGSALSLGGFATRSRIARIHGRSGRINLCHIAGAPAAVGPVASPDGSVVVWGHVPADCLAPALAVWRPSRVGRGEVFIVQFRYPVRALAWLSNNELLVVTQGTDLGAKAIRQECFVVAPRQGGPSAQVLADYPGRLSRLAPYADSSGSLWAVARVGGRAQIVRVAVPEARADYVADLPGDALQWSVRSAGPYVVAWCAVNEEATVRWYEAVTGRLVATLGLPARRGVSIDDRGRAWYYEGTILRDTLLR